MGSTSVKDLVGPTFSNEIGGLVVGPLSVTYSVIYKPEITKLPCTQKKEVVEILGCFCHFSWSSRNWKYFMEF